LSGTPQWVQYDVKGSVRGRSHFQHRSSMRAPHVGQLWGSSLVSGAAAWRLQSGLEQMAITAVGIAFPPPTTISFFAAHREPPVHLSIARRAGGVPPQAPTRGDAGRGEVRGVDSRQRRASRRGVPHSGRLPSSIRRAGCVGCMGGEARAGQPRRR
jgi:hypothetical protein